MIHMRTEALFNNVTGDIIILYYYYFGRQKMFWLNFISILSLIINVPEAETGIYMM